MGKFILWNRRSELFVAGVQEQRIKKLVSILNLHVCAGNDCSIHIPLHRYTPVALINVTYDALYLPTPPQYDNGDLHKTKFPYKGYQWSSATGGTGPGPF